MKQKSLKKNFIYNFFRILLTLIFPLISFPYSSRILLPEGIGKVDFANSIVAYFVLLASLGITTYGIREGAKLRDDKEKLSVFFKEILTINIISTIISYIGLFLAIYMIPNFYEYRILLLINSATIIFTTLGVEWLYGALEEYKYITIRSLIFNILSIILLFTFVKTKDDYIIYAIIHVISSVGSNIMNFINVRKYIKFKTESHKLNLKKHIKPILLIFSLSIASNIYMNFDKTCLGLLAGDESVGYYTTAQKVVRIVQSLILSLGTVLLPRLSYYIEKGKKEEFRELIIKAFNFVLMFSLPATTGLIILSSPLINIMSGAAYAQANLTMKILSLVIPIIGISNIMAIQVFIPMRKEKYALLASSLAAGINLIANIILIPQYKHAGAAIGTVLAEGIALIVCIVKIKEFVNLKGALNNLMQYIIGTILIIGVYILLKMLIKTEMLLMLFTVILSVTVYFTYLLLIKNEYIIQLYNQMKSKFKKEI